MMLENVDPQKRNARKTACDLPRELEDFRFALQEQHVGKIVNVLPVNMLGNDGGAFDFLIGR